uniref:Ig-like domain-containing protein n=1 Tax=Poecilia formosa TaxID=48698 RepID=A0A096M1T3_POEFO
RSVCVLKGSSVSLTCFAENPAAPTSWHYLKENKTLRVIKEISPSVTYNITEDGTLTIRDVKKSDEYSFCCQKSGGECTENRTKLHVAGVISELQVKVFPASEGQKVTLMCSSSCSLTESPAAFIWYQNGEFLYEDWSPWYQELVSSDQAVRYSCAIKGYEDLRAPDVSVDFINSDCFGVTYSNRSLCVLEGASVNISSKYTKEYPAISDLLLWYKIKRDMKEEADVTAMEAGGRVEHNMNKYEHTLTINNLMKNDSGEYMFTLNKYHMCEQPDLLGAILVVTGSSLKVTMTPSDVVTKGQKVTLTCSTSCPLSEETTYLWFFNEQPLSLSGGHNKQVVLNPVRSWHAGKYSCAIRTPQNISSTLEVLTVRGPVFL